MQNRVNRVNNISPRLEYHILPYRETNMPLGMWTQCPLARIHIPIRGKEINILLSLHGNRVTYQHKRM